MMCKCILVASFTLDDLSYNNSVFYGSVDTPSIKITCMCRSVVCVHGVWCVWVVCVCVCVCV